MGTRRVVLSVVLETVAVIWRMRVVLTLVAVACVVCVCAGRDTEPQAIHLAFGKEYGTYAVGWLTGDKTSSSTVKYGTSKSSLDATATGSCSSSDIFGIGHAHEVILSSLPGDTLVYYQVGDAEGGWSGVYAFRTTREAKVAEPYTFGIYGDLGVTNGANTMRGINSHAPQWDFVVHAGDISYANDHPLEETKVWREFFGTLQPTMTSIPYMVGAGNHEAWNRESLRSANFTEYKELFTMPMKNQYNNMFYSFDYGVQGPDGNAVHIIMLSTESDYPGKPTDLMYEFGASTDEYAQVNWVAEDLKAAAANRHNVPWIVVVGHRPIYCAGDPYSANGKPAGNSAVLQAWLEKQFKEAAVDAYVAGHSHLYQRSWPVYNNVPVHTYDNPGAPVYLVSGAAGNAEGHSTGGSPLVWTAYKNNSAFGYSSMTIYNSTTMLWEWRAAATDKVVDSFVLTRPVPTS